MGKLFEEILDDTLVVVTPAKDVIESREAVGLAGFFLFIKLFGFKLVVANDAPVIARCVHWKTRCQGSIDANDHRVLTSAAVPRKMIALHEADHLPKSGV